MPVLTLSLLDHGMNGPLSCYGPGSSGLLDQGTRCQVYPFITLCREYVDLTLRTGTEVYVSGFFILTSICVATSFHYSEFSRCFCDIYLSLPH